MTKIAVSLYLRGPDLDPEVITAILGTQPTYRHKRGEKSITSTGRTVDPKTGVWAIRPVSESEVMDDHVGLLEEKAGSLLESLSKQELSFATLPGVKDAYLDIFYIQMKSGSDSHEQEFSLAPASIMKLAKFNLPIMFTIDH